MAFTFDFLKLSDDNVLFDVISLLRKSIEICELGSLAPHGRDSSHSGAPHFFVQSPSTATIQSKLIFTSNTTHQKTLKIKKKYFF